MHRRIIGLLANSELKRKGKEATDILFQYFMEELRKT
jgi:hypothetical protein